MSWWDIYHRGARRLADRNTYVLLVFGILGGIVPPCLLEILAAFGENVGLMLVVAILGVIWVWVAMTFTWGALSIASVERPGVATTASVARATWAQLGSFLVLTLILLGIAILAAVALGLLALIGLAGTTTLPILGLLTPAFLAWGLLVFAIIVTGRLAFASLACEPDRAGAAVRKAWTLCRSRTADALLWLAGEWAILAGITLAIVVPVLAGASSALSLQWTSAVVGGFTSGDVNGVAAVSGAALGIIFVGVFALMVLTTPAAFTAGSAVGFYQTATQGSSGRRPAREAQQAFCDQCGAPRLDASPFCDLCGAARVLV